MTASIYTAESGQHCTTLLAHHKLRHPRSWHAAERLCPFLRREGGRMRGELRMRAYHLPPFFDTHQSPEACQKRIAVPIIHMKKPSKRFGASHERAWFRATRSHGLRGSSLLPESGDGCVSVCVCKSRLLIPHIGTHSFAVSRRFLVAATAAAAMKGSMSERMIIMPRALCFARNAKMRGKPFERSCSLKVVHIWPVMQHVIPLFVREWYNVRGKRCSNKARKPCRI